MAPLAIGSAQGSWGWTSRLLVAVGVIVLAWCAVVVIEARVYQRAARQALAGTPPAFASERAAALESPPLFDGWPTAERALTGSRPATDAGAGVAAGTALATLSIPRVRLSVAVLHGADSRTLRRGAGHIENTSFPGDAGNVAIAGHRDSFFRPLQFVHLGDEVLLDTPRAHLRYRVVSLRIVGPTAVEVLKPTRDPVLTLVTCYPFGVLGSAPDRFVVQAARIAAPVAPDPVEPAPAIQKSSIEVAAQEIAGPGEREQGSVRQAVERFTLIYNARLVRRAEVPIGVPLVFRSCSVTFETGLAFATCSAAATPPAGPASEVWVFTLARNGDGAWAIRSVAGP